jgi:hypothetical protein
MTSIKATQIFGIILALAFVLILTKPASAEDYGRDGNRQAYEDLKDFAYFAMDVKDAFFSSDKTDTIVYDQRTYINYEAPKHAPIMENAGPHKPPKEHKKPKRHKSLGDFKVAFDVHKR